MKKLISIVLVAMMLLSVLPMATFATTAPVINGEVAENEYANTTGELATSGTFGEGVFPVGNGITLDAAHNSTFWWDADDEYLYLAYRGYTEMNSNVTFYLNPNIESGARDTIKIHTRLQWKQDGAIAAKSVQVATEDSAYTAASWDDYVADVAFKDYDNGAKNANTVEFKIKRSALNYSSKVGVRAFISPGTGNGENGEIYWGTDPNADGAVIPCKDIWCYNKAAFKVIDLPVVETESETTPAPTPTSYYDLAAYGQKTIKLETAKTPEMNAAIGDGEYEFTHNAVVANDATDDFFFIRNPDKFTGATYAKFYIAADAENVYFASVTDDTNVVDWQEGLFLSISAENTSTYVRFFVSDCGAAELIGKGPNEEVKVADYIKGSARGTANGETFFEVTLSRAALEKAFGTELDKLLFAASQTVVAADQATVVLGFDSDALSLDKYPSSYKKCYPFVLDLTSIWNDGETETETETPAGEPIDLTEYGQKTITIAEKNTPTVDGAISDTEYAVKVPVASTNAVFGTDNITATDYYFSYDDNNLYIGGIVKDASEHVNYAHSMWVYLGGDMTDIDNLWRVYMTKANGTGLEHWQIVDGVRSANLWNPTMGYTFAQSFDGSVYTYEIALDLEDWGITGDKAFIALAAQSSDGTDYFGFKNASLDGVYNSINTNATSGEHGIYPHVISLAAAPETEPDTEPETDAPVATPVDALVGENEYDWTSGSCDRNTTVADKFYVVTPHTDSVALSAQWWLDYDKDFIYVAYKERTGYNTTARIDLSPNADAAGKVSIEFSFDRVNANGANTGYDIQSVKVITYAADGTATEVNASDFIASQAGSWFDDGMRNVNTVEFVISRAALAKYAGVDSFSTIGLRGYSFSQNSSSMLATANEGYHTINLFAPHTCAATKWDADKSDVFGHYGKCDVCGEPVEAAHTYGRERVVVEATCVQPGRVTKTCVDCEYIFTKATEADPTAHKFANGKCAVCGAAETVETDPVETEPTETEPTETKPVETKPVETKPVETKPVETKPVETTPVETEPADEKGCGGSIAAVAVALVAALGTCVVFAGKKRD